jgi:DNA-binding transcriptional LysR family regulator
LRQAEDSQVCTLTHEKQPERQVNVAYVSRLQSDDMATLKVAACRALGIVSLPGNIGRKEVNSGLLVRVLPEWHSGIATVSMLLPSRRGILPSVKAFIEFLSACVPKLVGIRT